VVSLGMLVAILVSSTTFAASNPERAYGEIIPPSVDALSTTAEASATAEATMTAEVTGTVEATGTTIAASTAAAAPLVPVALAPPAPKTVVVPSVMGKTKRVAIKRLKARKLKVKVARAYSTKKSGTVISQTHVKKRRAVGSTVKLKVAKRWPSGFHSKAASDRFWRPYVVASYKKIDRTRRYRGHYKVCTAANVSMTLRAIWGESRGGARAGVNHHDGYLGLLQMDRGYGTKAQRLNPIYSIKRMGRGIKSRGAGWARSRWSTI
jgi:hypothetical protein